MLEPFSTVQSKLHMLNLVRGVGCNSILETVSTPECELRDKLGIWCLENNLSVTLLVSLHVSCYAYSMLLCSA